MIVTQKQVITNLHEFVVDKDNKGTNFPFQVNVGKTKLDFTADSAEDKAEWMALFA